MEIVEGGNKITDKFFSALSEYGGALRQLRIHWWQAPEDMFIKLTQSVPQITHLSLHYCQGWGNETLKALKECCPNLEYLNIGKHFGGPVSAVGLIRLVEARQDTLKELVLPDFCVNNDLLNSLAKCPNFKTLDMAANALRSITASNFSRLRHLQTLIINEAHHLEDSDIKRIFGKGNLSHISRLKIAPCLQLTDAALNTFAFNLPNLTHLCLDVELKDKITNDGVILLMTECRLLQELHLIEISGIKAEGFNRTCRDYLTDLRVLNLWGSVKVDLKQVERMFPVVQIVNPSLSWDWQ